MHMRNSFPNWTAALACRVGEGQHGTQAGQKNEVQKPARAAEKVPRFVPRRFSVKSLHRALNTR